MYVREEVAKRYMLDVSKSALRASLGHVGNSASCHDDTDLAITSPDLGLGTGLFRRLTLTQLIPEKRLNEDYLLKRLEAAAAAFTILKKLRGFPTERLPRGRQRLIEWLRRWQKPPVRRRLSQKVEEMLGILFLD